MLGIYIPKNKILFYSMPSPSMIACGLSLPHRSKMGLTGLKYGRKLVKAMKGSGAYKKDVPMIASGTHGQTRTLKFR
jgi:hypothetical protein